MEGNRYSEDGSPGSGGLRLTLVTTKLFALDGSLTFLSQSGRIPFAHNGPVAQLGARLNRTEEAESSNLSRSTRMVDCRFEIADWHPRQSTILNRQSIFENGPIAQLGARLNGIEKVES